MRGVLFKCHTVIRGSEMGGIEMEREEDREIGNEMERERERAGERDWRGQRKREMATRKTERG